jgi:hypothetical protein
MLHPLEIGLYEMPSEFFPIHSSRIHTLFGGPPFQILPNRHCKAMVFTRDAMLHES